MDNQQADQWNTVAQYVDFTLNPNFDIFEQNVSKSSNILDYGCGYGRLANQLNRRGYSHIFGFDTSVEMINRGKSDFPHLNLQTCEFSSLPCEENRFDAVICCAVLTCIPDFQSQNKVLAELQRVLKPSGFIYIAEFGRNYEKEYDKDGVFKSGINVMMKHFQSGELLELLKRFEKKSFEEHETSSLSGKRETSLHFTGKNL